MDSIKDIIATRELDLTGSLKKIIIHIGKPILFPEGKDYFCPYQIIGLGSQRIKRAAGVDSIQALMLALKMIGADIYASNEAKTGSLKWEGSNDFGFPLPDSMK